MRLLWAARIAGLAVVVAMFAGGLWLTDHRFDEALDRLCVQGNEGRDDLRHALADTLTENLVGAAETPPEPVRVERYRTGLLEDLEREFPDREC